jgi:hypothetical protein
MQDARAALNRDSKPYEPGLPSLHSSTSLEATPGDDAWTLCPQAAMAGRAMCTRQPLQ